MKWLATLAVTASLLVPGCADETQTFGAEVEPLEETQSADVAPRFGEWRSLFNGEDYSGWRVYRGGAPGDAWAIEDGAMKLTRGGGGDLVTEEEFGSFELSLEWKISPNGNSGVMYLVKETDAAPNTYNTGPEMQVLDNDGHPDGGIPSHRAGALYDFAPPLVDACRPVGEWNEAKIVFDGASIEHWLNGSLVASSSYGDDAWRQAVAASKFQDMPLFGQAERGRIALQDHGDVVWYRNIRIRTPE